ncbi:hypothetical protein AB0K14_05955 [Actinosynnema sp. NPDC050801]|uniref:hypothetical protein n=1 Tax=unclassified Actinosynnema TaxID=2637065 RepID=UPI0033D31066
MTDLPRPRVLAGRRPMGTKGVGEIGIVGTAAGDAIVDAAHRVTGVRDPPVTLDHFLR